MSWVAFAPSLILLAAGALTAGVGRLVRGLPFWREVGLCAVLGAAVLLVWWDEWGVFGTAAMTALLVLGGLQVLGTAHRRGPALCNDGRRRGPDPVASDSSPAVQALLLCGLAGAVLVPFVDHAFLLLGGLELCGFVGVALIATSAQKPGFSDGDGESRGAGFPACLSWQTGMSAPPTDGDGESNDVQKSPGGATASKRRASFAALTLQVTAAVVLLLGVSMMCVECDSVSLSECRIAFVGAMRPDGAGVSPWGKAALVLIVAGLAMRLLFVPFHFGRPQLLANASLTACGYVLTIGRAAALIALLRLALLTFAGYETAALVLATVLAGGTMLIGTALATNRPRVRESLIWLAVGQGGVTLFGLAATWGRTSSLSLTVPLESALLRGEAAAGLSAIVGLLSVAGIVAALQFLRREDRPLTYRDELQGLFRTRPLAASAIAVALLNLVGVPPLPGFWARLWTLLAALAVARESTEAVVTPHPDLLTLAVILLVQTLLAAVVVWRLLAVMLFDPPVGPVPASGGRGALLAAVACVLLLLTMGFAPTKTIGWLDAVIPRPGRTGPPSTVHSQTRMRNSCAPPPHPSSAEKMHCGVCARLSAQSEAFRRCGSRNSA